METSKLTDNELIAEFMKCSKPPNTDFDYFWRGEFFKSHNAKWNTSWDWLMPVVEKIATSGHMVQLQMDPGFKDISACIIARRTNIISFKGDSLLDVTHKSVIAFIKWHNQQTK